MITCSHPRIAVETINPREGTDAVAEAPPLRMSLISWQGMRFRQRDVI